MNWLRSAGLSALVALYAGCTLDTDSLRGTGTDAALESKITDASLEGKINDSAVANSEKDAGSGVNDAGIPINDSGVLDAISKATDGAARESGWMPHREFQPDDFCIALYHFNLPDYTVQSCAGPGGITDNGTSSAASLDGFGEARSFDGSARLIGGRNVTLDLVGRLTAEMIIQPDSEMESYSGDSGNLLWLVEGGPSKTYRGFGMQISRSNTITGTIGLGDGTYTAVNGATPLPADRFSHIAFTYDGAALRIFVNGREDARRNVNGDITRAISRQLHIGADPNMNNAFKGVLDEIRISNAVRTFDYFPDCYFNNFDEDSSISNLTEQNGVWDRNPSGYLEQTEVGGGWRMSYINNRTFNDFDATIRIRVPAGFGGDSHTALLFRYTRGSLAGYDADAELDRGYALELERGDGTHFDLTLEDANRARLATQRVEGSFEPWHELRVRAVGNTITAYFNGREEFSLEDSRYSSGRVGFGSHFSESYFDGLEVCPLD